MTHFKDIDSTQISLGKPERKKVGSFNYTSVPILCRGKPLIMRASGRLEIYEHAYEHGKDTFTIGLDVGETNLQVFEDIECKIQEETVGIMSNPAVPKFKQKEFKLIKKYESAESAKVYSKLYAAKNGKIIAKFYEKVIRESGLKKRVIPDPRKMVGVPFDGEVILQLQRLHFGSAKTITTVVKEVLVNEMFKPESFFDDLSDDEETDTQGIDTVN